MSLKLCGKCGEIKSTSEFYKHKRDGYQSWCKNCKREESRMRYHLVPGTKEYRKGFYEKLKQEGYFKDYFQRPEVKKKQAENQRKYYRNPQLRIKYLARAHTKRNVNNGTIEKKPCFLCGETQAQIHHPNYEEPSLVVWLCPSCHKELHKPKIEERNDKE